MTGPNWNPQWAPGRARQPSPFGGDVGVEPPPRVVRLDGGIVEPFPQNAAGGPPPGASRVEVIEPTDGWWNRDGAFGYRFTGDPTLENEIVALTENLHMPGPPSPVWVQFFRFPRDISAAGVTNTNFEFRGRVTYGVGGVQNIVEVDVIQGIQLPVVASSIKVDLLTYRPRIDDVYSSQPVVAGAMFGKGAGSGALPPTWTSPFYTNEPLPGPGLVQTFGLPAFARSVGLYTTVTDPTLLAGSFLGFNAGGVVSKSLDLEVAYELLQKEKGIPIPAGTNNVFLNISNAIPDPYYFGLQFFLAL